MSEEQSNRVTAMWQGVPQAEWRGTTAIDPESGDLCLSLVSGGETLRYRMAWISAVSMAQSILTLGEGYARTKIQSETSAEMPSPEGSPKEGQVQ